MKKLFVNSYDDLRWFVWVGIVLGIIFGICWLTFRGDVEMFATYCSPNNSCSYITDRGNYQTCPAIWHNGFFTKNDLKLKSHSCSITNPKGK